MSESWVGRTIGHYEVLRELGRGGMGIVYKAHETSLNRPVALKVLPAHLAGNDEYVKRFTKEARAAARLNHPHVVTIYAIDAFEGSPFIAMEYVKGRELAAVIAERGPLPMAEALEIAAQVASALAVAHGLGIIHRDIKPQNVMIDAAGRAKVMDFGIAKVLDEKTMALTQDGSVLGTPAYMSPEQCSGGTVDARSDVYSVGVLLYQMLAGAVPFRGETPLAILHKILNEPPPPVRGFNPAVPAAVVELLDRALAKAPDKRHPTAAAFESDLRRLAARSAAATENLRAAVTERVTLGAGPPPSVADRLRGLAPRLPAWAQGLRGAAIASAAAAGLLIILAVARAGRDREATPPAADEARSAAAAYPPETAEPASPALDPALRLDWTEGPPEGGRIRTAQVRLAWRPVEGLPVSGFLLGINEPAPRRMINEPEIELTLTHPGPQTIHVVAVGKDGRRGETLARRFDYLPNRAPEVEARAQPTRLRSDETFRLTAEAHDPDGDEVRLEFRLDDGAWRPLTAGGQPVRNLRAGVRRLEVRAIDAEGLASDRWTETLRVEAAPADPVGQAVAFYTGQAGRTDEARAREMLQAELARANPRAQMWLAWLTHWGRCGLTKNPTRAAEWAHEALPDIRRRAEADEPEAAFLLGAALDEGIGAPRAPEQAVHWVSQAAQADFPPAMNYWGWMQAEGRGVKQDDALAVDWFLKAADAGDTGAMHNLGWMYADGRGVARDDAQAFAWFLRGAETGSPRNMNNVGWMLEQGRGRARNRNQAVEWYQRAARLGDATARENLERLGERW